MRLIINVLPKFFASCPAFSGQDTSTFHLFFSQVGPAAQTIVNQMLGFEAEALE
jgi:hypothetical protein